MRTRYSFKLLDLCCGEGLAAWGYWLSGCFSEIVGIDINPDLRARYSFDFIAGDALKLDYEFLSNFDFVHASPPCQAYSKMTPFPASHPRLVAGMRLMLHAAGVPHVIENVENSTQELRPNLVMNGQYFGLPMDRKRYFYVSTLAAPQRLIKSVPGANVRVHGGDYLSHSRLSEIFGLHEINDRRSRNLTRAGIEQGIPPAFTKRIAEMVVGEKLLIA